MSRNSIMEKILEPINCDTPICHIQGICQLKPILMQAQSEHLNHLDKYILADLINQKIIEWIEFRYVSPAP